MRDAVGIDYYRVRQTHRLGWCAEAWTVDIVASSNDDWWTPMLHNRPGPVFLSRPTDLFADDVSDMQLLSLFRVMDLVRWRHFQIVTFRARRLAGITNRLYRRDGMLHLAPDVLPLGEQADLENIWLGVEVHDAVTARMVMRHLITMKCGVRFVRAEPLVDHVDLSPYLPYVDWVLAGGEVDPAGRFRRMKMDWARDVRDACVAAERPFFFTQRSGNWVTESSQLLDVERWRELPRREPGHRTKASLRRVREQLRAAEGVHGSAWSIRPLLD